MPAVDRGIKNWMFVSVAIVLAEIGQLLGGVWRLSGAERVLDGAALFLVAVMMMRFIIVKLKRKQ